MDKMEAEPFIVVKKIFKLAPDFYLYRSNNKDQSGTKKGMLHAVFKHDFLHNMGKTFSYFFKAPK